MSASRFPGKEGSDNVLADLGFLPGTGQTHFPCTMLQPCGDPPQVGPASSRQRIPLPLIVPLSGAAVASVRPREPRLSFVLAG